MKIIKKKLIRSLLLIRDLVSINGYYSTKFDGNFYLVYCVSMFVRGFFVKVKPKVVKSVHYCPATEKTIERTYTDLTSLDAYPSTAAYPTQVLSRTFFFQGV